MEKSVAPIVVLRDANVRGSEKNSFDDIRSWLAAAFPEFSQDFRVLELPDAIENWDGIRLLVNWTLDPVELWSKEIYQHILSLQNECDERRIPVINRVERQVRAGKIQVSQAVRKAGIRSPQMVMARDAQEFLKDFGGLQFPFMLRENWGHRGEILRIEKPEDISESQISNFVNPVAIEIVDVRDKDHGWYRMRRYLSCGPMGVSLFTMRSENWLVRDHVIDTSYDAKTENQEYCKKLDPNHEKFQAVANIVGLDVLAFDYSIDSEGQPVVWEVNPYTRLRFSRREKLSQASPAQLGAAAIVAYCRMRAGLPVNKRLIDSLGYSAEQVGVERR